MLEASEFLQVQNNTRSQGKVVEKIQGWRMFQRNFVNTFFFLAVSQKPSFPNLQDIRIQRNELLRNVTRPFTWKHSQTQAAWVNSWYKEHHLLTGRILTDPDSFARHCMGLPDNPAFSWRCVVLFTFPCSPVLFLVSHLSCSAGGSQDSPVTRHVPAVRTPHLPISLPFHFVIEASNVELLPPCM